MAVWPSRAPSALPPPPWALLFALFVDVAALLVPQSAPQSALWFCIRAVTRAVTRAVSHAVTLRALRTCESGAGARCAVQRALCSWGRRSPWPWLLPRVPRRGPMA